MAAEKTKMKPWLKKLLIGAGLLFVAGCVAIWFIFTEKFTDTTKREAAYTVNAMDMIGEFTKSEIEANKKYTEQIVTVNGRVSEIENADTATNIKMTDTISGAYIIFAFQQQHLAGARQLKEGDSVSIKGSCSGGTYSEILETVFINFKRSAVNK